MLKDLDLGEFLAEAIDNLKSSLLNVEPLDEVLEIDKTLLVSCLFHEIFTKTFQSDFVDKEAVNIVVLHQVKALAELDHLVQV